MLINILEGGGGSYLSLGAPLTFLEGGGGSYLSLGAHELFGGGRRVLLESGCSLTFLEW